MMKFKHAAQFQPALTEREVLEQKYKLARNNLLIVIVFTLLNMILMLAGSDRYMLFSASVPYFLVLYGMLMTGKMPAEWYEGDMSEYSFLDTSFLVVMTVLAFFFVAFYALVWYFSRNKSKGWMIAALVFIVIDTIGMFVLLGFDMSMILDLVVHIWIIYELAVGIITIQKLKNLPPEEPQTEESTEAVAEESSEPSDPEM